MAKKKLLAASLSAELLPVDFRFWFNGYGALFVINTITKEKFSLIMVANVCLCRRLIFRRIYINTPPLILHRGRRNTLGVIPKGFRGALKKKVADGIRTETAEMVNI